MFETKAVDKTKTRFILKSFRPESRAVYEIMWKNNVQPGGSQMTI